MPEQVPPGVARAFEVLIPAVITLAIIAFNWDEDVNLANWIIFK